MRSREQADPGGDALTSLLQRAQHLRQAGRAAEAFGCYRQALAAQPKRADIVLAAGATCFEAGDPSQAMKLVREAIALRPGFAAAHNVHGNLLRALRRLGEAEAAYRRALEIAPDFVGATLNLAILMEEMGRPDEAEAGYRRVLAAKPDFAPAHDGLGRVLERLARPDEAEAAYRHALEAAPSYAPAHCNLGNLLQRLGRLNEAVESYRQSLQIDPAAAGVYNNLGLVLQRLGRLDQAESAFRRAVTAKPDYASAHYALGSLLLRRGDARAALRACEDCLRHEPGNGTALAFKAVVLRELGCEADARALADFDRFLRQVRIVPSPGYDSLAAFNAALGRQVRAVPSRFSEPGTEIARQTRDLMVDPQGAVAAFREVIVAAATEYSRSLPAASTHPFVANRPRNWRLTAWATILNAVREPEISHLHPTAWLSGVYYVELPEAVRRPGECHDGWIEFGRPSPDVRHRAPPDLRLVQPQEGLLLLFPSYFYHRVMPFEGDRTRISIAFDVIAQDGPIRV